VSRVVTASTIGVYGIGNVGALREDMPLSLGYTHAIPTFKKIFELLAWHLTAVTDVTIVNARISGIWGPGGHLPDPFFATSMLGHAAAHHREPDLSGFVMPSHAEDALDLLYAKDAARALALLELTEELHQMTYNVASGRATSNAEVIAALRRVQPDFRFELPSAGDRPRTWLDITRLREDTGFEARYDTAAGNPSPVGKDTNHPSLPEVRHHVRQGPGVEVLPATARCRRPIGRSSVTSRSSRAMGAWSAEHYRRQIARVRMCR